MKTLKESLLNNAGLGKRGQIEKWLQEMDIKNYTINPDMTIDVNGNVFLYDKRLKEFPSYIQFNKVGGNFHCFSNILITLRGCPKEVEGDFDCSMNKLKSLEYGPENVGGSYNCSYNNLITLKGCPKEIKSIFNCGNNQLTSLEYCPEKVNDIFCCNHNNLETLEGNLKKVNGSFMCICNKLISLKGCPEIIYMNFHCNDNKLTSFEDGPKKVEGTIFCSNNKVKFDKSDILKYCKVNPYKIKT